ncbi:MAG: hypothetical protein WCV86_05515 [Patescibacteria group bacterium]|jgi:hypothetical protein
MNCRKASKQKIFNTVFNHLLTQGRPAVSPTGECMYRQEVRGQVRTCAVGCLIPKAKYDPSYESFAVAVVPEMSASEAVQLKKLRAALGFEGKLSVADKEKLRLLESLQTLHDMAANRSRVNVDGTFSRRFLRKEGESIAAMNDIKFDF